MQSAVEEMCVRLQELNHQYETAPDEGAKTLTMLMMRGALGEAKELAETLSRLQRAVLV